MGDDSAYVGATKVGSEEYGEAFMGNGFGFDDVELMDAGWLDVRDSICLVRGKKEGCTRCAR